MTTQLFHRWTAGPDDRADDRAAGARADGTGWRGWLVEHRPFLVVLCVGALLRVVAMVAFTPAFIHNDGPTYLYVADPDNVPEPIVDRPAGYSLIVLRPILAHTFDLQWVTGLQHVFGLLTGLIVYTLLRHWGVGRRVAAVAAAPVLLDAMQLQLEHSTHSDSFFVLLVTGGIALLVWRRRLPILHALAGGALLGTAMTVRQVGGILVVSAVLAALLLGGAWWRRVLAAAVVVIGFVGPPYAYASWYEQERGVFALSEGGDQALYSRVVSFVDCAQVSVPDYQRVLCPVEERGERLDPVYYTFEDPRTVPRLVLPPGVTDEKAMGDFARATIRAQPLDYAWFVTRDVLLNFDPVRVDRFGYQTADRWEFRTYIVAGPAARSRCASRGPTRWRSTRPSATSRARRCWCASCSPPWRSSDAAGARVPGTPACGRRPW